MDLMELLKTRRTYRCFDGTKAIPDDVLDDILKALQYSSSAMNSQSLEVVVIQSHDAVESVFDITKWAASLPNNAGRPKDGEHPTMFIALIINKEFKTPFSETDAGIALSNMTLAAWNKGVGSCIIKSFDEEKLRQIAQISDNYDVHSVVAFGYPTIKSTIVEIDKGESTKYYIDDCRNYYVPKRKIKDITKFI